MTQTQFSSCTTNGATSSLIEKLEALPRFRKSDQTLYVRADQLRAIIEQHKRESGEAVVIPWMTNGLFVITFNDFVEYGRKSGGNIVNGMPWSFKFDGIPVTHETDTCYLLCRHPNDLRITPNTVLIKFADGSYDVQDKETTFKDYPFLNKVFLAPEAPQPSYTKLISELVESLDDANLKLRNAKDFNYHAEMYISESAYELDGFLGTTAADISVNWQKSIDANNALLAKAREAVKHE